jgi:hypothetical protein
MRLLWGNNVRHVPLEDLIGPVGVKSGKKV